MSDLAELITSKPQDEFEYREWLLRNFKIEISKETENCYNLTTKSLYNDLSKSKFWKDLNDYIVSFDDKYYVDKKFRLLTTRETTPEIDIKEYKRFLDKTFRKNVVYNKNWPLAPKDGWVLPENWFEKITDVLRTTIVVKYLDGVEYIIEKIKEIAIINNIGFKCDFEAREEGYYAAHILITDKFDIPLENFHLKEINFNFEIQITTQIQDILKTLLHKYYEKRRSTIISKSKKWQWDYTSEEFAPNYLGHILHYVEGMIMELRSKN